jgi:hypothetical protein
MPIDYSKYPPNWKTEIVPRILKRAENKCEVCGLENKDYIYSLKVYVRVPETGRYGYRSIWLSLGADAERSKHLGVVKKCRVILTVAHLDHDETNHDVKDDRLSALCQYCHLNYDAKEKYRRACGGEL